MRPSRCAFGRQPLHPRPDHASAVISRYTCELSATGIDGGTPHAMDDLIRGWTMG